MVIADRDPGVGRDVDPGGAESKRGSEGERGNERDSDERPRTRDDRETRRDPNEPDRDRDFAVRPDKPGRSDPEGSLRRVLVVGIDAGCFPVIDPLVEDGSLPTLRSLLETGVAGQLTSQIPPWTASAWPSLYTGKNPGKHGVFDFLAFDGYDWDVVNASHVRERTIWELMSDRGRSSVVVNVPVTHPPRPFDGALIPGITAPADPTCHPEGLLEEVREAIGEYHVYPRTGPHPAESIESYTSAVECRGRAFRYLAERFDPDFGFVQFQATDSIFHERPGEDDVVRAVYEAVDEQLGAILEQWEPDATLVVSDHGIGPVEGWEFRSNEFLRDAGYVKTSSGGEEMPTWSKTWENALLDGEEESTEGGTFESAVALAARVGLTTQRVAAALDRVGLKAVVGSRVPNDAIRAASEVVDFPASEAYVRSKSELGVRLNLAGREPDGVVPPDEYEQVRDDLIDLLSAVETPDGEPMFETVAPRETYFEGAELDRGPDVLTVPADFDNAIVAELGGGHFGDPWEPYNHEREGLVIAAGEAIDVNASLAGAHLFDVAPTILSLFGLPVDAEMDGEPLPLVEHSGVEAYPTFEPSTMESTDDAFVEERLADLGYL